MAVSSPLNPPSAGGLAGRPTRQVGGVRRQNETPLSFQNRLGGQPAGVTPPPMQTREDRVLAARMDGTFDAKRSAFNAAAKGQFMDEAANITATSQNFGAANAAPAPSPQFASAPAGMGGSKMVQIPATPTKPAAVTPPTITRPQPKRPEGKIDNMPASQALAQARSIPMKAATGATSYKVTMPQVNNLMKTPAQTPKATAPVYAPGSLEARAQALGNAMQLNNSRQTAATVAKASQVSQDMKMAPHRALNASMSAPLPAMKQMQTGLPMANAAGPGANLNTTPLTPAEQLAESVRPGSVAAHRGVSPPKMTIAARADGGPVQAGKPYLVGERGPELIVPQQAGTVIPNHQLPAKVTAPSFKFKPAAALMAARG